VRGVKETAFKVTDGNATKTYTVKIAPASNERTIYFKGGWSKTPYVYIYSEPSQEYAGAWPGSLMSVSENGWYSYVLPEKADESALVIFNTGDGGADRYPADQQPGIALDFPGKEGWYLLADKKWYSSNPEGPQKPAITVSPAGGRVRGTSVITISFSNAPTLVSGTFNGRQLSLSTTSATRLDVADYLNDGESATLSLTASNDEGETTFSATYNRDDSQPVTTLTGDHRELSIYQVMVGSFQHGEGGAPGYTNMWGPEGHRKDGNLRGIINSLDYIKELGMNALWMTPVFDSTNGNGGERLQATGYFCTNYFKIDPKFGTEAEFDELIEEAHNRGIYVILDGVFGHHGGVTAASPEGRYIDTRDNTANVRGSDAGNIAYPGSLEYFKEVVRYWMNRGVDGWRLDQCYQVYQGGHNYWYDLRKEAEAVCQERKN
ncbi:MAG: starch-binding protein, partial [Muribaculaceae bacterium]|nr:starch-binding protein [Muribaculaceae bacterium]